MLLFGLGCIVQLRESPHDHAVSCCIMLYCCIIRARVLLFYFIFYQVSSNLQSSAAAMQQDNHGFRENSERTQALPSILTVPAGKCCTVVGKDSFLVINVVVPVFVAQIKILFLVFSLPADSAAQRSPHRSHRSRQSTDWWSGRYSRQRQTLN